MAIVEMTFAARRQAPLRWAILSALVWTLSCARDAAVERDGKRQTDLLAAIRAKHDSARRARTIAGSSPADFPYGTCPEFLAGAEQSEVAAALGAPDAIAGCGDGGAECRWFYYFYYLPPNYAGGGPEVQLSFTAARHLDAIHCVTTQ
jgi:hypothetical protein